MIYRLVYERSKSDNNDLCGYINSDYKGNLDRKGLLAGYVCMFHGCTVN